MSQSVLYQMTWAELGSVAQLRAGPEPSPAILRPEDCPEVPDPLKQKYYRSYVAKLQLAASWIRFDIPFVVLQLAWFVLPQVYPTEQLSTI